MKIGVIVQARVSSTRLPNKVLKDLPYGSGITVLEQVIRRLKRSKKLNDIVVATTVKEEDNVVVDIAEKEKVKCFRGSNENVLSRHCLAAKENGLDIIVRITSDCPCIDSEIVDLIIEKHIELKTDYTSSSSNYPRGLDTEVFNFEILEEAHKNAKEDYEKEHVTPYIYKNCNKFKTFQVEPHPELYAPELRITLDTEEDYVLLCTIFDYLYLTNEYFNAYDIISLFKKKPWLKLINEKVIQKKALNTLEEELEEGVRLLELQDLKKARDFLRKYT